MGEKKINKMKIEEDYCTVNPTFTEFSTTEPYEMETKEMKNNKKKKREKN